MRILFGIQGTGNGHIGRCRVLAKAFKNKGIDVDYIFSGREAKDYFGMQEFEPFKVLNGISFATENGRIKMKKTIRRIRAFRLIKDIQKLDLSSYNTIISDFEPVSAWAAYHQHRECIGISNQSASFYLHPQQYGLMARVIMKFYAPVSVPVGLHWFHFGTPIMPPIVEPLTSTGNDGGIVVYLPFESIADIRHHLSQFPKYRFFCFHPHIHTKVVNNNISFLPLGHEAFTQMLAQCSGIISNTGFSLISEALTLGKKILTKPVVGQFEQLYNADCLEQLNLASVMRTLDKGATEKWLVAPESEPLFYPDVASELVDWIVSGRQEDMTHLSQRLWKQVRFPAKTAKRIHELGY